MKLLQLALLGALTLPTASGAWETGRELSEVTFSSTDTTANGYLDFAEVTQMAESIAYSADSDEDKKISMDEFMVWDFGHAYLASEEGEEDKYNAVKRVMFAVYDLNGDGAIDEREVRRTTRWDFERADADGDALLTENEYLTGWMPIVMLKAGPGM